MHGPTVSDRVSPRTCAYEKKKREAYQPCLVLSKKFYTLSHQIGSSYLGVLNKILLQNLLHI